MKMNTDINAFFSYLNKTLEKDISYRELANLCLTLFCDISALPEKFKSIVLDKETLASIFSKIAKERKISPYPYSASFYGASFHNSYDKGHWLEVMASLLKLNNKPNIKEGEKLLERNELD